MSNLKSVPQALRNWFVVHFIIDILFAIPLMFFPEVMFKLVGWQTVDVIATRIVAAALFGIGIESWLGRNAGREAFIGMLNLKIIWSLSVIFGLTWSLVEGAQGRPFFAWLTLAIFVAFNFVWVYWRRELGKEG